MTAIKSEIECVRVVQSKIVKYGTTAVRAIRKKGSAAIIGVRLGNADVHGIVTDVKHREAIDEAEAW